MYGNGNAPALIAEADGRQLYPIDDALGSVIAVFDRTFTIFEKHSYSPYGESNSVTGVAFQYAGMRIDAETGLYYARNRYYSPKLGRFLQADPSGVAGGINLYAYTSNDSNAGAVRSRSTIMQTRPSARQLDPPFRLACDAGHR